MLASRLPGRPMLPRCLTPAKKSSTFEAAHHRRCVRCFAGSSGASDYYALLGISATASADDIKTAFRKLALKLHPDVNKAPEAEQQFRAAKDAYETLSDDDSRAVYDAQQVRRASSRRAGGSGSSGSRARGSYRTAYSAPDAGGWGDDGDGDEWVRWDGSRGGRQQQTYYGFTSWHEEGGSWQSSWQANRKKRRAQEAAAAAAAAAAGAGPARGSRRARRQQAQRGGGSGPHGGRGGGSRGGGDSQLEQLLSVLDAGTLAGLRSVFGSGLEGLSSSADPTEDVLLFFDLMHGRPPGSSMADFSSGAAGVGGGNGGGAGGGRQRRARGGAGTAAGRGRGGGGGGGKSGKGARNRGAGAAAAAAAAGAGAAFAAAMDESWLDALLGVIPDDDDEGVSEDGWVVQGRSRSRAARASVAQEWEEAGGESRDDDDWVIVISGSDSDDDDGVEFDWDDGF